MSRMDISKDGSVNLSGVKIHDDWIKLYKSQVTSFCIIYNIDLIGLFYEKN